VGTKTSSESRYEEHAPARASAAYLACTWTGQVGDDGGYTNAVLPDACIDIVWDGRRLFVAGPDTGPVETRRDPGSFVAGARFRPGHAPAFLTVPAAEITDQRVDLAEFWGASETERVHETLAGASTASDAARRLARAVDARVNDAVTDGRVADEIARLATQEDANGVAHSLGVTTRTLHRRCLQRFGYGVKTLQQVLRFRRFLELAERAPTEPLALLAADAGYADQSHLTRDCRRLAGLPPAVLLEARGVRSVQDRDAPSGAH
jgi:methylphosphotriester-DNA--protein-cysteine methyltransferase